MSARPPSPHFPSGTSSCVPTALGLWALPPASVLAPHPSHRLEELPEGTRVLQNWPTAPIQREGWTVAGATTKLDALSKLQGQPTSSRCRLAWIMSGITRGCWAMRPHSWWQAGGLRPAEVAESAADSACASTLTASGSVPPRALGPHPDPVTISATCASASLSSCGEESRSDVG